MNGATALPSTGTAGLRVLAVALFTGILLSTAGAFDTEAAAFGPRLIYWLIVAAISTVSLEAMQWLLQRRWSAASIFSLRLAGWAAMVLPLNAVAALGCKLLFGGVPSIAGYLHLLPGMATILAALQLVLLLHRPAVQPATSPPLLPPRADAGALPATKLADLLPLPLRSAQIRALVAEDHYVRIHTGAGQALVRMRFSDAVDLVNDLDGLRPHRSWWVARSAVRAMQRDGSRTFLLLRDGQRVPVSRRSRPALGPLFADPGAPDGGRRQELR